MKPLWDTRLVEVGLILRHPKNPNELERAQADKIRKSIRESSLYPILIVRSLEASVRLRTEHAQGMVELLDGEHRLDMLLDENYTEVMCAVWPGVTDWKADYYLATLNHGGKDNETKRAALIRDLLSEKSIDELVASLPDDDAKLRRMMEVTDKAMDKARGSMKAPDMDASPLTVFCSKDDLAKIKRAIKAWTAKVDPGKKLRFAEGSALAAMAEAYRFTE